MPGYVLHESDRSGIASKYLCLLCDCLLRNPVQTACGHCYCRSCIENLLKNGKHCVSCEELLSQDQVFPDNFMKREVLALKVHCPDKEEGCNWMGEVRTLEDHTTRCDFVQISCPHATCGMMIRNSELVRHLEFTCACRQVACRYCGVHVGANVMEAHHSGGCIAFPVNCSKCNKEVQRSELANHQDPVKGDCEAIEGPCPFVQAGCPQAEVMRVDDRKKHLKDAGVPHLTLLLANFMKVNNDVQSLMRSEAGAASGALSSATGATASAATAFLNDSESTVRSLATQVENMAAENRDLRQKLRDQSDRITSVERKTVSLGNTPREAGASTSRSLDADPANMTQEEIVRRLVNVENKAADHDILLVENSRNVEDARHQNSYLQRQVEQAHETIRRLERRVESQDHMLALRNVALADLEEYIRQQEVSSYNGTLLWKISDFARRRNDARREKQTSFYSACFCTSGHGYKMCARIYLNGDGIGLGTHISLFFVVMRGKYDENLDWPFRRKITFILLDQEGDHHVTDAFKPDPNDLAFQKPSREMNIASGCPLFCPLSDLDRRAYVLNDTIIIKIIVEL